jgi:hypothetical protein
MICQFNDNEKPARSWPLVRPRATQLFLHEKMRFTLPRQQPTSQLLTFQP